VSVEIITFKSESGCVVFLSACISTDEYRTLKYDANRNVSEFVRTGRDGRRCRFQVLEVPRTCVGGQICLLGVEHKPA